MKVAIFDHQGKSETLARALASHGIHVVPAGVAADVLLIDYDLDTGIRGDLIRAYRQHGALILVYPHGARPTVQYDGIIAPHPLVDGYLAHSDGYAEILRRFVARPVHVVGWFYCEQRPFTPPPSVRRVLFAPLHPFGDGHQFESFKAANAHAYRLLLERADECELLVHLFGSPGQNGLWADPRVCFAPSRLNLDTSLIDAADLVVADCGTYGYLSVARGKPTLTVGSLIAPSDDDDQQPAAGWAEYGPLLKHPHDATDYTDIAEAISAARAGGPGCDRWRARYVGEPLEPAAFATLLTRLREEHHVREAV